MRNCLIFKILFFSLIFNFLPFSFSRKVITGVVFSGEAVLLKRSFSDSRGIPLAGHADSSNYCSWYGVSYNTKSRILSLIPRGCHGDSGNFDLAELSPFSGRVAGVVSPELAEIRVLYDLSNLEKLEVLGLHGNNFIWKFPTEFSELKRIKPLNLGCQQILSARRLGPSELFGYNPVKCRKQTNTFRSSSSVGNAEASGSKIKLRKLLSLNDEDDDQSSDDKNGLYPIEIASIVSASIIVIVLIILVLLFFYTRKWKGNSQIRVSEPREIRIFVDIGVPLTYEKIIQATGNFSNSNCIGHGGFGSTYKAEVAPNAIVAVKRLSVGRFQGVQQFLAEIKTLETVKHPNLVTLIGYHASEAEMFLIYNYLPFGNLEDFIKERSQSALQWKTLHKIALDVARALAYLHPKVLHRDIKPSNILLDSNLNAYLSDFGLSKLLGTSQSHVTTGVAGTFGYVAPEYAMTCRVSEKADVYSYGIVLLELISDKRALDPSFSSHENGFNIVSWAHMMLRQGKADDVFVAGLWGSGPRDDMVEVLHLALKCTMESLSTRPTMRQVVQQLKQMLPFTC